MAQRVLVVDDDRQIVRLVQSYLEKAGLIVLTAYDGENALRILRHERPDLLVALHAIACEAFPDIPGEGDLEPPGFDEWRDAYMGGAGDSPEATFVAVEHGSPVGYAKLHLSDARPGVVLHDITAVRRDRRRRGIAGALKAAEIAWAIAAGYERLETANEARNEPIRRLNEKLGYRELPGRTLLRGPLAP